MEKITVRIIVEILGRPPEHIKEALTTLVLKIGSEKGVKIIEKNINDPVHVKDAKDLYTTFAEVTLELDSLAVYFGIMFAYMPSHIEIISPESVTLHNYDLTELGNKIVQRLHDYDAITKRVVFEKDTLAQKLREVAPHLFKEPAPPSSTAQNSKGQKKAPKSPRKASNSKKSRAR